MTPLKNLRFAVLDFEGTDYAGPGAHIVEVAVAHVTLGGVEPELVYSTLVRPPIPIPERVTEIHGISDADVENAPSFAAVAPKLLEAMGDLPVLAFNAPADWTFLATELERLGLPAPKWPWLDLYVVRRATKTRGRPGNLSEIAAEFGFALDAHGAVADCLVTGALLTPMMRAAWLAGAFNGSQGAQPRSRGRYDDDLEEDEEPVRVDSLEALLLWQRGAALFQEADFARYCRGQGHARPPRCGWHIREGVEAPTWDPPVRAAACAECGLPVRIFVGRDGKRTICEMASADPHQCK